MEWIPLPDYENGINLADRPRKLSTDEIAYIVAHLPTAPSADSTAAAVARQGTIEWMMESLKEISIAPSAIPSLIQRIIEKHNKSLVVPGTPVGITAAEAVGATTTQMTLNSVAPHEQILIQEADGTPHLFRIGDWIDQLVNHTPSKVKHIPENRTQYLELTHPVSIATPNENGVVTWENITAVTKHLPVGDMVKVITKSGREVTATQSKSLLVWDGQKLVQREGKDIKVNDLVPTISQMPDPPVLYKHYDLRTILSPKEWLYGSELYNLDTDHKTYNASGKKYFWTDNSRLQNLPYSRGNSALNACRTGLDAGLIMKGFVYPKSWGGSTKTMIPELFPLDLQFGQLVGLYLSEGWATDTFVGISNNAQEIQNIVYRWCDRFGITYHITLTESAKGKNSDIKIHSVLLARWFKKWMGTGSSNKIMPPEILLGNHEFIKGVLDGYFAGDGTVNKIDSYLSISSVSKDLITGFGFLCSRIGIFGEQSGHQPKSNNIKHVNTYSIRNRNAVIWANLVGSCQNEKQKLMDEIKFNLKGNTEWDTYYQKQNNVMLDPIVSVEFVPATEYVYDLTVPATTNFSLWNGLGVADTFHTSGSAKSASFGIEAMRDLIFARKTPKNESCTIHFTNKSVTYEEVLDYRRYIVGSMVSDFIKDYDIDTPENLERFWWHGSAELLLQKQIPHSTKVLRLFLNVTEMFKHKVTIADLAAVLEREVPPSAVSVYGPIGDGIIDLYPHPNIITDTLKGKDKDAIPPSLAELTYLKSIVVPELKNIRVKGISGIRKLYPLVSPVWRMVLLERKLNQEDLITVQLREGLEKYLGDAWMLFYNPNIMRMTGLVPENLSALCQLAGLTLITGTSDRLIVNMPNDRFRTGNDQVVLRLENKMYQEIPESILVEFEGLLMKEIEETKIKETEDGWTEDVGDGIFEVVPRENIRKINNKFYKVLARDQLREIDHKVFEEIDTRRTPVKELKPSEYVNEKVTADKKANKAEIKRLTDLNILATQGLPEHERRALIRKQVGVQRTRLMKAAEFIIADTDGANLKELLALPGIDKMRTTCNNMYTVTAALGIEAARTFLIRALTNTIANTNSYVHPANITFIAEFITSRGEPYGATYTGISRQPGGHLSLATLERAGKVFTQNALHGRKEDIRNVSASVAVGARMAIGSGAFDIAQDITEGGVTKIVINDDLFTALQRDDATLQLAEQRKTKGTPIGVEDLIAGIDDLKTITLGGTFDFTGAENEANLLTLYDRGEIIPDIGLARPTQPVSPRKVVRRVAPQAQKTPPQPVAPRELIDVLETIKIGIPIPETGEKVAITPLETGVTPIQEQNQPVISTGLVPLDQLFPKTTTTGIPDELEALFGQYETLQQGQEPVFEAPNEPQVTIVEELPREEIPQLPGLEDINIARDLYALRREQVRGLEPINTGLLQNAITKQ